MDASTRGKLYKIFEAQQISDRFRKREFVLELDGRYPQYVLFQLTGDRCEDLDKFKLGQAVEVDYQLRGREWTSPKGDVKYFNSLEVRGLSGAGAVAAMGEDRPPPIEPDDSDIPF